MEWSISPIVAKQYLDFCEVAAKNDEVFSSFKRNHIYREILEHVGFYHGQRYLDAIKQQTPELITHFADFATNDKLGNPFVFDYEFGSFSPTTLRYIKVLSDLKNHFVSLDDMDIAEIGGGYGGQCKIIYDLFKPANYTIIDDPKVYALQKKYLSHFGITPDFGTGGDHYDLVISNYCFDELDYELQCYYRDEIIQKSIRGYFTMAQPLNQDEYFPKGYKVIPQNYIQDIPNHRCVIF